MKVAIISDTHDQLEKVETAISSIQDHNCQAVIHCGDWCSPFVAEEFVKAGLPVYTSMGNNDGDRDGIRSKFQHSDIKWELEEEILELEIDNKKFAVNHYPDVAEVLAASKQYDVICYGHNHKRFIQQIDQMWMINPGALIRNTVEGWGFAIYDTVTHDVDFVDLSNA